MTFEEMQMLSKVRNFPYKVDLDEEELAFVKTLDKGKIMMLMYEFLKSRSFTEGFLREWIDYCDLGEVIIWQKENISKDFIREFATNKELINIVVAYQMNEKDKYLDKNIKDFVVVVENQESIHTTLTAVSVVTAGRDLR